MGFLNIFILFVLTLASQGQMLTEDCCHICYHHHTPCESPPIETEINSYSHLHYEYLQVYYF